jgi:hypothetical protein
MPFHISAIRLNSFRVVVPLPAVWKKVELPTMAACLLGQGVAFSRYIHRLSGQYTDA